MADYTFVTTWQIDFPVSRVWHAIEDADRWPTWWKGVLENYEIRPGDENGIGSIRRSTWKSILPYKLTFDSELVRVDKYREIEARAFGDLTGHGRWLFTERSTDSTIVRYDWNVVTDKAWMNLLSPVARPVFRWNHDIIMGWGENGLKDLLSKNESYSKRMH